MAQQTAPPEIALCAGLKSSGSTWLYNAVIQILETAEQASTRKSRGQKAVLPFYADGMAGLPKDAEHAKYLIIKTHVPSEAIQFLARFARAKVVITVREPRDAIASVVQRFGHPFQSSLKEVASSATSMVELARRGTPMILRYEDRFFESPVTISEITAFLAKKLPRRVLDQIHRSLTPESVHRKIMTLTRNGVFGPRPDADRFDPKTHWHPGHLGDGSVEKYKLVLSIAQQKAVLAATEEYCRVFGYSPKRRPKGLRRSRKRSSRSPRRRS